MADKTLRNHVSQVLLRLQVPDRTAAALEARDAGLQRERRSTIGSLPIEPPLTASQDRNGACPAPRESS